MANVYLRDDEIERRRLPDVCLCCGEPADRCRHKEFHWLPPWVLLFLLVALPLGLLLTWATVRRRSLPTPLCPRHWHHWTFRTFFALGGLVLCTALVSGTIFLLDVDAPEMARLVGPTVWLLCLGWLLLTALLLESAVRATEITRQGVTLTGVSPAFAAALDDRREEERRRWLELERRAAAPRPRPRAVRPEDEHVRGEGAEIERG